MRPPVGHHRHRRHQIRLRLRRRRRPGSGRTGRPANTPGSAMTSAVERPNSFERQGRYRFGYARWAEWCGWRTAGTDSADSGTTRSGQLVAVTNAAGGETRFEYSELGQRVAMIDPAADVPSGGSTRWAAPRRDRCARADHPVRLRPVGRLTHRIDPTGSELSWTYRPDREVAESFPAAADNRRLHDPHGARLRQPDHPDPPEATAAAMRSTNFVYDADGGWSAGPGPVARAAGAIGLSWSNVPTAVAPRSPGPTGRRPATKTTQPAGSPRCPSRGSAVR
ncbi:hypothetical protein GJV80_00050 [Microlunatus sp. Gsoil 973]|nr:hypothetical protein GJV80_00050 [Microlunatus sp. Gsoil 973]